MVQVLTNEELKVPSRARFVRDEDEIDQRFHTSGQGSTTKTTLGLLTCIRVAVVGYVRPSSRRRPDDRFLAHVDENELDPLDDFIANIDAAKKKDLRRLDALMVVPNTNELPGDTDLDKEDKAAVKQSVDMLYNKLLPVVGGPKRIQVKDHPWGESWSLTINADKTFARGPD